VAVTNTLAYFTTEQITTVKSFVKQATGASAAFTVLPEFFMSPEIFFSDSVQATI
jgi:hypothetical protein